MQDQSASTRENLIDFIERSLVWADRVLQAEGWTRRHWRCPGRPLAIGHAIFDLFAAARERRDSSTLTTHALLSPVETKDGERCASARRRGVRSCSFHVQEERASALGGLGVGSEEVELGSADSEAELHLFPFDALIADALPRFNAVTSGWFLRGRYLAPETTNGIGALAILAERHSVGDGITLDRSVGEAHEALKSESLRESGGDIAPGTRKSNSAADNGYKRIRPKASHAQDRSGNGTGWARRSIAADLKDALSFRVGFYVASLTHIGGLERWVIGLCGQLSELGMTCFLFCLDGDVPSQVVPQASMARIRLLSGDPRKLGAAVRDDQLDVLVVNHAYAGLDELVGSVDVVEILHNIYFWQRHDEKLRKLRRSFSAIVSISETVTDYALSYLGISLSQITLVEHGVDHKGLFRPLRIADGGDAAGRDFKVVSVANLYPQKNTLALVRAFERAFSGKSDVRLDLVGARSHDGFAAKLQESIASSPMKDSITLHGALGRKEISKRLVASSAFCLPSLYEGFGLASVEAMYFGLPLVLSNTGHSHRLVSHENGVLVPIALNFDELDELSALNAAMDPADENVELLARGLREARERYAPMKEAASNLCLGDRIRTTRDMAMDYMSLFFELSATGGLGRRAARRRVPGADRGQRTIPPAPSFAIAR